jgi:type III restriction/modification enzyme restriction subunit
LPAYRFSWDPFDASTVLELPRDIGYSDDPAGVLAYLVDRVARPNDDFIRRTKDTLARVWLPQHAGVGASIVRELFDMNIGPRGPMPDNAAACAEYIIRCRNSSRLRDLLFSRLISFGDVGSDGHAADDNDFIPSFGVLVPGKQVGDQRRAYAHQEQAWAKLDAHLREAGPKGVFKGVLVMPTGSGKTFTAAHWLTRRWLDTGNRVLFGPPFDTNNTKTTADPYRHSPCNVNDAQ